jgi:uncharacterized membrane protein
MKKVAKYFFEGLIFVVPIAVTAYVIYKAFVVIDSWLPLPVQGLGFLVVVAGITAIGFLASNFITRSILGWIERILERLPVVKFLHSAIKDVISAFVGERKRFDKPVLVDVIPGTSIRAIGFMTRESMEHFGLQDTVAVYFPQSYNVAGNLLMYPKDQVHPLQAESSKVMAFIVSGGITS